MVARRQFVFAYGSLVSGLGRAPTREVGRHGFVADLAGFERVWGVAMDNRRNLPGYKYYTDARGHRPRVHVAFLDLRRVDGPRSAPVNGLCAPVDPDALERLDLRERNYERVDVSDRIDAGGARVWAYLGTAEARERLAAALWAGTAVIDAGYVRGVEAAFAALGDAEHHACRPSLDPGEIAVVELIRHEVP